MRNASLGFSLVELIITIILLGILSAAVITNLNAKAQHSATVQADQLRRDISHLQLLAISRSSRLRLTTTSTGYSVAVCGDSSCGSTSALTDPATGQNFSITLTDGVTLTISSPTGAGNDLDFDSLGRPASGSSLITDSPARTYTLTGDSHSVAVSVLPITGFAQTTY